MRKLTSALHVHKVSKEQQQHLG